MVKYKPDLEGKSDTLLTVRNWGICIIFSIIGGDFILSEIRNIRATPFLDSFAIGRLLVLIITLFLVFHWIFSTHKELKLCFYWLDPKEYTPPSNFNESILIVLISIFLGLLYWVSNSPLLYGVFFTMYSLIVTYATYYVTGEMRTIINFSLKRLKKTKKTKLKMEYTHGIKVLKKYYIKRPQTKRYLYMNILGLIGIGIGVMWKITNIKFIGFITYLFFFSIILISEIIIITWRNDRDKRLREIESNLNELIRNT